MRSEGFELRALRMLAILWIERGICAIGGLHDGIIFAYGKGFHNNMQRVRLAERYY
jgi:hypothetical protein